MIGVGRDLIRNGLSRDLHIFRNFLRESFKKICLSHVILGYNLPDHIEELREVLKGGSVVWARHLLWGMPFAYPQYLLAVAPYTPSGPLFSP
eukprot:snap_masked-scaffold_31-processed-gene-2.16-mRNA-1 protein AED:1.00 eAED:1.00 QI:0/0/0/0/1/1/2/0/91